MERKIMRESEEIVLLKEQEDEIEEEEDEDEEALSLCDLPNNEEKNQNKKESFGGISELAQDQDFDFDSCGCNLLEDSQMCTADEVFYQGQILPLRHSISFPSDSRRRIQNLNLMDSILRSESMDHCHDTNSSSRSSSIRSQRSSSSGSSSTCSKTYKPKIRNQFHSHPSPTPQVRSSKVVQSNINNSSRNKSTLWSHFRVGLVTTPEIALQDLKTRTNNKEYSGSRNSTSSTSSNNDNKMRSIILTKKKKQRFFLGGSCKCSVNAVAETVPQKNSTITKTRKTTLLHDDKDKTDDISDTKGKTKKQAMSRHRTFEWLKQLSLEGPVDET